MTQLAPDPVKPDLPDPVQLMAADVAADVADDVEADVADDVGHDVMMTSSLTRLRPDPTHPDIDTTRSTTRLGQRPGLVNGQRPDPTRSTKPSSCCMRCHALPHAPNLLVAREGACDGISGQT